MAAAPTPGSGDDASLWTVIIAAGGFVLQLIISIGTAIWAFGRTQSATDDKIADKDKAVAVDLAELERRLRTEIAATNHDFGETALALREKIRETELWNRDTFVSKRTFETVIVELRRGMEKIVERVDDRFDKLEDKLDGKERR